MTDLWIRRRLRPAPRASGVMPRRSRGGSRSQNARRRSSQSPSLSRENRQKRARVDDHRVPVLPEGEKVVVTGHEVMGAAEGGAPEQIVVVGVAADLRGWFVRQHDGLDGQELE